MTRYHLIAPNECWVILRLCENIFIIREEMRLACELTDPYRQINMLPLIWHSLLITPHTFISSGRWYGDVFIRW